MRSIRLSLLVYFLGLLAAALTGSSLLVYRSAQQTLRAKEEAAANLVQAKYTEHCREERQQLDDALLKHAQALSGRVLLDWRWGRQFSAATAEWVDEQGKTSERPLPNAVWSLGVLSAARGPYGPVAALPWAMQCYAQEPPLPWPVGRAAWLAGAAGGSAGAGAGPYGYAGVLPWLLAARQANPQDLWSRGPRPPQGERGERGRRGPPRRWPEPKPPPAATLAVWRSAVADLNLNLDWDTPDRKRTGDYYQIDVQHWGSWGKPLRSKSLGGLSFPQPADFGGDKLLHWEPDNFELPGGRWVRRVRVKASSARSSNIWRNQPAASAAPPPPPPVPQSRRSVFIVLQVAADQDRLDALLARRAALRDGELARLRAETAAALEYLRNRLLAICAVTFVATVLGAWVLVRFGLAPLRRMSEAVSRVSPRDFRLPLGDAPLPLELRPIAERLGGTLELLKRAFAREKQSTADISHELRTPLAAMLATTELALRKQRSPEQYREFLQDCRASAQVMNQIVERLLTLARLDAGVDRLRPQAVDVAEVAAQCAAVVRPLAEAQGLSLAVHDRLSGGGGGDAERLSTDPDKLREVLNNLLHNAIQYNRPAGRIDLTVARENGCVRLEVRDTGVGIAPASRDLIFERFYRADPSRNGDGMHAGLGLALVKEYVDLMGGRIAVDSTEGQGSTFRVELPLGRTAAAV